jgi:hypothetical protein
MMKFVATPPRFWRELTPQKLWRNAVVPVLAIGVFLLLWSQGARADRRAVG